jgi:hypothetical protein
MLLIQTELNGRIMQYHLKLGRHHDQLDPMTLRLVNPWGFGSIVHATPVRLDPSES